MNETLLINAIKSITTDDPYASVDIDKLKENLRVTENKLFRGLSSLEDKGYLTLSFANNKLKFVKLTRLFPR